MRVLITTGIYPPDIGGPATYVPKIAATLAARGHEVVVVTMADSGTSEPTAYGHLIRIPRQRNVVARKLASGLALFRWVVWADLVYAQGLFEELLPARLLVGRSTPHVVKFVGDWAWDRSQVRGWYQGTIDDFQRGAVGARAGLLRTLRSFVARRYGRVVVPSAYLAGVVRLWYRRSPDITVVHNGLSIPDSVGASVSGCWPEDLPFRICTVCRLVPWKRVGELLEILAEVPGIVLCVVGDGELRESLVRKARDLGLADRVSFPGALPHDRTLAIVREADLFVLNSEYEGLPHVVVEAMALECPVLARRSGGTAEAIVDGETGIIVDDADTFRARLAQLRDDPDLRRKLGAAGQRRYKTLYTDQMMFDRTIALLEKAGRPPDKTKQPDAVR